MLCRRSNRTTLTCPLFLLTITTQSIHIVCNYTLCVFVIDVYFDKVLVVKILLWKSVEHIGVWVDDWLGYIMQSITYTTELFLPGTWLLDRAPFILV